MQSLARKNLPAATGITLIALFVIMGMYVLKNGCVRTNVNGFACWIKTMEVNPNG